MANFNQMAKAGVLVRKDAFQIRIEDLHIKPGFNLRDYAAVDQNGESYDDYVKRLMEFLAKGGQIPPLEVEPREEGGAWIVDGEGRYRAICLGLEQGKLLRNPKTNEFMVDVRKFEGNDADKLCRIFTSNEGRKLTPLERAPGMAKLIAMGWTEEDVAYALGCNVQTVHNILALRLADESVKQMIRDKQVSATTVSKMILQHGEKATEILKEEL